MVITEDRLQNKTEPASFHPALRIGAKIISVLFHPLFIPVYVSWFLVYEERLFSDRDNWRKSLVIIQFFVSYTFLPLITILLAKALGFVQTVYLKTQRERILPYVICEVFYFWGWYVSKNLLYPKEVQFFTLGVFLASCLGLILNSYLKLSMHALSMGVLVAFVVLAGFTANVNYGFYISLALLIAGIVCTARMLNSDHTTKEVYTGFFAGALMQVIAYFFV
jgi:hypothetical protein